MAREGLLAAWQDLPEGERRSILAKLQKRADEEGEAVKESPWLGPSRSPVVDVYSARKVGDALTVYYLYDFRISRQAQSGSDWDEHYHHLGEAVCRNGRVESIRVEKEMFTIPEHSNSIYDERAEVEKRRAATVEAHRKKWGSQPLPRPE